jgi:hypothetical protein
MKKFYRASYNFWRAVGATAYGVYHLSQSLAHKSYLKGGKSGRRAKRPLTAFWAWARGVKSWIITAVKR